MSRLHSKISLNIIEHGESAYQYFRKSAIRVIPLRSGSVSIGLMGFCLSTAFRMALGVIYRVSDGP